MTSDDITALTKALMKVEFFAGMTIANIELVLKYIQYYEYDAGEMICKKGDPGDAMYIVQDGQVEIFLPKFFGFKKTVVGLLRSGQFFGEMALLDQKPRSASAQATTSTKLFTLLSSDFELVLHKNPTFAQEIRHVVDQRKYQTKRISNQ